MSLTDEDEKIGFFGPVDEHGRRRQRVRVGLQGRHDLLGLACRFRSGDPDVDVTDLVTPTAPVNGLGRQGPRRRPLREPGSGPGGMLQEEGHLSFW